MSDLKRSCPGCDAWTSAVGAAFRDGLPCPYCGLPADAAHAIDVARDRKVADDILERVAAAEIRAAAAERRVADLEQAIDKARRFLNEVE